MDIGQYIKAVCKDLDESVAHCQVIIDAVDGIVVATDRAIAIALIVNELITNAAKYAYNDSADGKVWINVGPDKQDSFVISVRDEGAGLPPDFDLQKAKRLGMRIVTTFAKQLNATIVVQSNNPGTEFVLAIPLDTAL
jgi:two-component sensor histidine kinase